MTPMHWVAFGTYDTHSHPRVAVLIEGLRASGDTVTEVNAPLDVGTEERVEFLRRPLLAPAFFARLGRRWLSLVALSRQAKTHHRPDAVLVGYMGHFDVLLARLVFKNVPIVLDHLVSAAGTARDRRLAGGGGPKVRALEWLDRTALRLADVVVIDTEARRSSIPEDVRAAVVVVPVGATQAWLDRGRDSIQEPGAAAPEGPLRVIFVGLFTPLHGALTIGAALRELADDDIDVTMVGRGQDYAACRELAEPNSRVRWIDWVPSERLPELVAAHDVSLGIFGTTDKAAEVAPTKVYQAAAAGCAVLTSDTPPQRAAMGDAAAYVPAGDPKALAEALRALGRDRASLGRMQRSAALRVTELFTPAAVTAPMRSAVAGSMDVAVGSGRG